ncbi:hypothetical protein GPALN_012166 [Globodera pallida]|nr:hypothetical protein GPALN_012166 [Globodera pallida]
MLQNCVIYLRKGQEAEEAERSMEALERAVEQFVGKWRNLLEQSVQYIGRGNRRLADVLLGSGGSSTNASSTLHFVLLYSESRTFRPGAVGGSSSQHDAAQFYQQCLGQLYQMAGCGKSCIFVDLGALETTAYEELPKGILALGGFPNIDSRLVKMRGHKLLSGDCVTEEAQKLQICIARIENSYRTEVGAVPQKKTELCSLPCPLCIDYGGKCQNNDFLWDCDDCGQTLAFVKVENVPMTHFYCGCGATPVEEFSFRCNDVDAHGNEFKHFASKIALDNALKKHFDRSTILQSFAEQLNALTGPNDKVGGGLLSLSVPTQQNLYAIAHDCARVSEVFASVPGGVKTNGCRAPTQNHSDVAQNVSSSLTSQQQKMMRVPVDSMEEIKPEPKKLRTLSRVQCAECDEIVSDSDASRLSHTNKHLKLCLYMCPVCHKEFMSTFNGGAGVCLQHIRQKHPEALLPSKAEISLPNLRDKMVRIRARAAELFALNKQ